MVNRGASRGCNTCKERRVKCDETKPICKECTRLGRKCAGYEKQPVRLRFKNETARYSTNVPDQAGTHGEATQSILKHSNRTRRLGCPCRARNFSQACMEIPRSLQADQLEVATAFFLTYVTDVGRDLESTRGLFEFILPVLATESHESALFAAVNATAVRLWARLKPHIVAPSLPIRLHHQALVKLRQEIMNTAQQGKESTVFAALMLQRYDTMAAVFDHQKANDTHRDGALALLTQKGPCEESFKHREHLLGNLFHSKISACVRHRMPLTGHELEWLQTEVIPSLPSSPSSLLDIIGISVSNLQVAWFDTFCPHGGVALRSPELLANVYKVDAQLNLWLDAIPVLWHPRTLSESASSSIPIYDGDYEIYPSLQIANIWNTWRTYRLIVALIRMELCQSLFSTSTESDSPQNNEFLASQPHRDIQHILDAMCRSLPFYLGDRHQPASFINIDAPEVALPSYHDFPEDSEAFSNYKASCHYVTKIDHYRHAVLHGPLHALSILSKLNELLSEEWCSASVQYAVRGQKEWLERQYHRSLYLMNFAHRTDEGTTPRSGSISHTCGDRAWSSDGIDEIVRQSLRTVTIL